MMQTNGRQWLRIQQFSRRIVLSAFSLVLTSPIGVAWSLPPASATTDFAYWCANRGRVAPETRRTIYALFEGMGIWGANDSTQLDCNQIGQAVPRISTLILRDKNLSDLRPLASFTNLVFLDLHHNAVRDISPLSSLTNLEQLYLDQNRIANVQALRSMRKLKVLILHQNDRIRDISPLAGLTSLSTLKMDYYRGLNLKPLRTLNLKSGGLQLHGSFDPRACPFPTANVCKPTVRRG